MNRSPQKRTRPKFPDARTVDRALDTLLEGYYPPPQAMWTQAQSGGFRRRHDDTDGERGPEQDLMIGFSPDQDAWIMLPGFQSLRFRTPEGGGQSPRVQKALMVLAEAMRRDNAERPQSEPETAP
jgi:hypothetical protein